MAITGPIFVFITFIVIVSTILLIAALSTIYYLRRRATRLGLPPPPWSSYNPIPYLRSLITRSSRGSGGSYQRTTGPSGSSSSTVRNPFTWLRQKFTSSSSSSASARGRTTTGSSAYEGSTLQPHPRSNARTALDPDEAWDTRVGAEADAYGAYGAPGYGTDEEQELGLTDPAPYGHGFDDGDERLHEEELGGYGRGRAPTRSPMGVGRLDGRYDEEMHAGSNPTITTTTPAAARTGTSTGPAADQDKGKGRDPFADEAAIAGVDEQLSLRGVSPRPEVDTGYRDAGGRVGGSTTPPAARKSIFREQISPPPP